MWPMLVAGGIMAAKGVYDAYNQNKSDNQTRKAQREQLALMQQAAQLYEAYRPQMMAARQGVFDQQMQAYQGANNALTTMYGQGTPESRAWSAGQGAAQQSAAAAASEAGDTYARAAYLRKQGRQRDSRNANKVEMQGVGGPVGGPRMM